MLLVVLALVASLLLFVLESTMKDGTFLRIVPWLAFFFLVEMWKLHCREGRIPRKQQRKIAKLSALQINKPRISPSVLAQVIGTEKMKKLFLTLSSRCDAGVCHHKSPARKATLMTWNILSLLNASCLLSLTPLCNSTVNWYHQLVHHCSGFIWFPALIYYENIVRVKTNKY